jgi:hypothetical protein
VVVVFWRTFELGLLGGVLGDEGLQLCQPRLAHFAAPLRLLNQLELNLVALRVWSGRDMKEGSTRCEIIPSEIIALP